MKNKIIALVALIGVGVFSLMSFNGVKEDKYTSVEPVEITTANPWDSYKSWYHITKEAPNTGDPTGFLDKRHDGAKAYREIYINDIGEATQKGSAPYKYPEGTIVLKETYKNKAAWEKKGKMVLTVMIKQAEGTSPETGDWGYIMGAKGKLSTGTSKWAKFCSACHINAAVKDYVYMSSDFMKTLK